METDVELLNSARRMDKDALVKVFDLYSSALYKYVLSLCYDPATADQIVGDVFAKLLDQFSSGQGPTADLRSYLYQATYHGIIDETRFSQHRASLEAAELLRQDVHAGCISLENQMLYKQILHAIRNYLTNDQRHVVILRFLEGFSLREIAIIIGKREDHVKVIHSRAIAKLRRVLNDKRVTTDVPSSSVDQWAKASIGTLPSQQ